MAGRSSAASVAEHGRVNALRHVYIGYRRKVSRKETRQHPVNFQARRAVRVLAHLLFQLVVQLIQRCLPTFRRVRQTFHGSLRKPVSKFRIRDGRVNWNVSLPWRRNRVVVPDSPLELFARACLKICCAHFGQELA